MLAGEKKKDWSPILSRNSLCILWFLRGVHAYRKESKSSVRSVFLMHAHSHHTIQSFPCPDSEILASKNHRHHGQ